jgi:hypothetical protein
MALTVKVLYIFFWVVTAYSSIAVHQYFGGTHHLRNDMLSLNYMRYNPEAYTLTLQSFF